MKPNEPPTAVRGRHVAAAAAALGIATAFALVPTPLWPLYARDASYSPVDTALAFAVYAMGVLAALVLAGGASDALGRRPVMWCAVALELAAAVLMWRSSHLAVVSVARLLTGIGVGLMTAAATAAIGDLARRAGGWSSAVVASLVTAATLGGFAFGSLSAGALAQVSSAPLRTPFAAFVTLLIGAGVLVAATPETGGGSGVRGAFRLLRPPRSPSPSFMAGALAVAAVNVAFGSFTVTAPGLMVVAREQPSPLWSGAVVALMFLGSAGFQLLVYRLQAERQLRAGVALLGLGLGGFAWAAFNPGAVLLLGTALALGGGAGVLFRSAVALAVGASEPDRSRSVGTLYAAFYLGLSLPVLGLGVLVDWLGAGVGVTLAGGVVLATSAAAARIMLSAELR